MIMQVLSFQEKKYQQICNYKKLPMPTFCVSSIMFRTFSVKVVNVFLMLTSLYQEVINLFFCHTNHVAKPLG